MKEGLTERVYGKSQQLSLSLLLVSKLRFQAFPHYSSICANNAQLWQKSSDDRMHLSVYHNKEDCNAILHSYLSEKAEIGTYSFRPHFDSENAFES